MKIVIISLLEFYLIHAKKTILKDQTVKMLNYIKETFNKILFGILESTI